MAVSTEKLTLHLRYYGPDVDDGSMSVEDIVPVLQGFSSAYGKLASVDDPTANHNIRVASVRPGSADLVLEVWRLLNDNAAPLAALGTVSGAGYWIVKKIVGVISAKRHVKKQPFREQISATNSIVIVNSDNATLEVPHDVFTLFKEGTIDPDLNKLTRPLRAGRIEMAELRATAADGSEVSERITVEERPYFTAEEATVTSTKEAWFVARLNSLTKSTNSGYLYLLNGRRVFYSYVGDEPATLYRLFSHDGPVRVMCVAHMDENLEINLLEIHRIEKTQGELFVMNEPDAADESDDV